MSLNLKTLISGTWSFRSSLLYNTSENSIEQNVNFTCKIFNNETYQYDTIVFNKMSIVKNSNWNYDLIYSYNNEYSVNVFDGSISYEYKNVDFGNEGQEVSNEFVEAFKINAYPTSSNSFLGGNQRILPVLKEGIIKDAFIKTAEGIKYLIKTDYVNIYDSFSSEEDLKESDLILNRDLFSISSLTLNNIGTENVKKYQINFTTSGSSDIEPIYLYKNINSKFIPYNIKFKMISNYILKIDLGNYSSYNFIEKRGNDYIINYTNYSNVDYIELKLEKSNDVYYKYLFLLHKNDSTVETIYFRDFNEITLFELINSRVNSTSIIMPYDNTSFRFVLGSNNSLSSNSNYSLEIEIYGAEI